MRKEEKKSVSKSPGKREHRAQCTRRKRCAASKEGICKSACGRHKKFLLKVDPLFSFTKNIIKERGNKANLRKKKKVEAPTKVHCLTSITTN